MKTSIPLFNSWKTDSGLNCIETTNDKECAGNTSRRLPGCDLPPIQTTWKSSGGNLSCCCHAPSRALRHTSGSTYFWGTSSPSTQAEVWECSPHLCSPNIYEKLHSKKSKLNICCIRFFLFWTKGKNDKFYSVAKSKYIAIRSVNRGVYFFKFLAKYTYLFMDHV